MAAHQKELCKMDIDAPEVYADPPRYWRSETNDLGRAVTRYLTAEPLTPEDIRQIALYLKRWIQCPVWDRIQLTRTKGKQFRHHEGVRDLRLAVLRIYTRRDIEEWRETAAGIGIDPF